MKTTGRLVALLLLLTVFLIRMASEILNLGYNSASAFIPFVALFCVVLLLWLATILWPGAYAGALRIFTATIGLIFVAVLYLVQHSLDLVAVLCAFVLFALSLGKGGEAHSGAVMPPTTSSVVVASSSSKELPKSVISQTQSKKTNNNSNKFVASKRGKFYHKAGSEWAEKIKSANQVWFSTKEAAWEAGYKAHKDIE